MNKTQSPLEKTIALLPMAEQITLKTALRSLPDFGAELLEKAIGLAEKGRSVEAHTGMGDK